MRPKVGAQLIIWGRRPLEDLRGVLEEASALGYAGVETGLEILRANPKPLDTLRAVGLELSGIHMNIEGVDSQLIDEALSLLREAGSRYLIFSGAGGRENSEENYRRNSKRLEEIGVKAGTYGVRVCYHNHWQEIVDDARGMRIILEETSPEHVYLCVDTYWVRCGGLTPAEFIRENLQRVVYLHFKDGTEEGLRRHEFTELGRGVIDFPSIMKVIEEGDMDWIVVEQDRTDRTPRESMAISREYLKTKLGL